MSGYRRKVRIHEGREFEIVPCQSGFYVRVDGLDMRHFYTRFKAWLFLRRLIRHQEEANTLANSNPDQEAEKQ